MDYSSARRCAVCGGLLVLTFASGLPTEMCAHHGIVIACPRPPIDVPHGPDPEPGQRPLVWQPFVLTTSTASR